jgi:hypothetical protein
MDVAPTAWRKSSYSGNGNCVEVAFVDHHVAVRDSKNRNGPVILFTPDEWSTFLRGACDGEFDLPRSADPHLA